MKEVRMRAVVHTEKCTGCDTCTHVCPTMAFVPPQERPVRRQMLPPCNAACPAGNDVEGLIALLQKHRWDAALDLLLSSNPLPGVTGRVCSSPCEASCNRGSFDQTVSIRMLERALADYAQESPQKIMGTSCHKERVAIVGSGPSGLSCAYHLARKGFRVTVFEKKAEIGGMLRYGIPAYRLPKDVLDSDVRRLKGWGIDFQLNRELGNNLSMKDLEDFDAVHLALGFHNSIHLGIPGEDCPQVISGLSFLEQINSGIPPRVGDRVLVIGGGNTAVDSARSALRLGARTTLVYRRRQEDMPAIGSEVEELECEGAEILTMAVPVRFILNHTRLAEVECVRMELADIEADGRRWTVPIKGSEFTVSADTAIVCIGERGNLKGIPKELASKVDMIDADSFCRTSISKIFAGGDISTGEGTVAHGIGSGRRGADAIEAYLLGDTNPSRGQEIPVVSPSGMNFDYSDPIPRLRPSRIPIEHAVSCFDEIYQQAVAKECVSETVRCLHCGVAPVFSAEHCLGCTNCSSRCPSMAISLEELEKPYVVKVDIEDGMFDEICRICEKAVLHPESLVCQCAGTRANEIVASILKGARTIIDIRRMTGAHTGCGSACISPIFRLMQAAGLEVSGPPQPDMWYPSVLTIWDIPDHVVRDFEARGFRFQEDKDFYNKWLDGIRTYCREKGMRSS